MEDRLTKEDIDRMLSEAQLFASEDQVQREKIVVLNSLSSLAFEIKSQLADQNGLGGKISPEEKAILINTVKDVTKWIDRNDHEMSLADIEAKLAGTSECNVDSKFGILRVVPFQIFSLWLTPLRRISILMPLPLLRLNMFTIRILPSCRNSFPLYHIR